MKSSLIALAFAVATLTGCQTAPKSHPSGCSAGASCPATAQKCCAAKTKCDASASQGCPVKKKS